ncbi:MAG: 3-hydroxy-5-phosphonooxypentane-2,4-dione thiolase [bacterium]
MDWGLQNRIAHIIKPDTGKTVMLAVDHGYFLGPTSGLENAKKTIAPILSYADSLMLTRGILRTSVDPNVSVPIVLRVSGGTSILGNLAREGITTSVKEAVRLNVSAAAVSIFIGSEYEKETICSLAHLVNECEEVGMPVLAVTAVGKDMVRDVKYLGLCCRIAAEHGAHIVKTYYCKDFEKIVASCPVPVVIAGGKKLEEKSALQLSFDAIHAGASGVDMGRNIFQSDSPVGMIQAVRKIVHNNASVKEAFDIYTEIKNKGCVTSRA